MDIELDIVRGDEQQRSRVRREDIIQFPGGLVGCEDWKRFVLLESDEDNLIGVLYNLDEPGVSLLVTDPGRLVPGYSTALADADRAAIGAESDDDLRALCVLVVDRATGAISANLLGPLIINQRTRTGRQVVLVDSGYSARHPVAPFPAAPAEPA